MLTPKMKADVKEFLRLKKKALTVPWKVGRCTTKKCWCAPIYPVFKDEKRDHDIVIAASASVYREYAKHIVKLHNESLSRDGE